MSKKKKSKDKWVITFANEPSQEAIQACSDVLSEAVIGNLLKHIQKEARESNP